jgi:LmbE family N-acetylglucosaminyl deacetylase
VSALQWFPGTIAIVAPHPDDETLGCGGLIALMASQREIHVVFATDGSCSPVPDGAPANPALVATREVEAREAMACLGVPPERLHFLRLPDGRLANHETELQQKLEGALTPIAPATVLVPFRYDWHPDHLAAQRVTARAHAQGRVSGVLVEYFVYTQRRLLPGGDIRTCLAPGNLWPVEIASVAARKREALECFRSQTTQYFDWQRRPILTGDVLTRACSSPEVFFPSVGRLATRSWIPPWWIGTASELEPRLKRTKDGLLSWLTS